MVGVAAGECGPLCGVECRAGSAAVRHWTDSTPSAVSQSVSRRRAGRSGASATVADTGDCTLASSHAGQCSRPSAGRLTMGRRKQHVPKKSDNGEDQQEDSTAAANNGTEGESRLGIFRAGIVERADLCGSIY